MKASLSWLNQYVDISGYKPEKIAYDLTAAGVEVETIQTTKRIDGLIVGHVKECIKHPQADKLHLCTVSDGQMDYQIVCGAPNVTAGVNVVLAKIGAVLPGDFKISKAKIRGIESFGMLCSERELGLSDSHDGIIILDSEYKAGDDANEILELGDTTFTIGITPNRGDCLSIYGIARDLAAIYNKPLLSKEFSVAESTSPVKDELGLEIKFDEACPYYGARVIKGVKIATSPLWIQKKLKSADIRPISNAVDITNYIMIEYGQPLHAFDRRNINKGIIVRKAINGEKATTLDGKERILDDNMVVIADHSKILALGGVMGSECSGISSDTVDIVLECAYFTPTATSYTSKKLGLSTDASYRYARGVDYGQAEKMLDYAANMLAEICGGTVCKGVLTAGKMPAKTRQIKALASKVTSLIGTDISIDTMLSLLHRLGIEATSESGIITALVPSYRPDILHDAGIAEEIARLYGLDNIPITLPKISTDGLPMNSYQNTRRKIRHQLADMGFDETINYSFMEKEYLKLFDKEEKMVDLINPISEEMQTLRTYIFPGIIKSLEINWNQGERSLRLFECAVTFEKQKNNTVQPIETSKISFGVMGDFTPLSWASKNAVDTFYYIKSVCENIFDSMMLKVQYKPTNEAFLHPGKSAYAVIDGQKVGFIGALHPDIEEKLDLKSPIYISELNLDLMLKLAGDKKPEYKHFSKFPFIYKDISLVISKDTSSEDIVNTIYAVSMDIKDVVLFDIYTGKGINEGEQSVTYRIYFSAEDRTFTDDEINPLLTKMTEILATQMNAKLRG